MLNSSVLKSGVNGGFAPAFREKKKKKKKKKKKPPPVYRNQTPCMVGFFKYFETL
jgi:hypothetical protein